MGATHTKPCGAFADVKELEYISALHQSGKQLRKDGSIHAIDIVHFLMSRYGIKVTEEEVKERILCSFGECSTQQNRQVETTDQQQQLSNDQQRNRSEAEWSEFIDVMYKKEEEGLVEPLLTSSSTSNNSNDDDVENGHESSDSIQSVPSSSEQDNKEEVSMDLSQVLALLLIPLLLKAEKTLAQQKEEDTHHSIIPPSFNNVRKHTERGDKHWPDGDLIDNTLRMMLWNTGHQNSQPLTKELLRQLLRYYFTDGELADDDNLLDEMLSMAKGNSIENGVDDEEIIFDKYSFVRALTHDIQRYDIDNENSQNTNYVDVFKTYYSTKTEEKTCSCLNAINPMKAVEDGRNEEGEEDISPVQRVYTCPSIDYTADTFRSKGFVVLLWVTWLLTFVGYLSSGGVQALATVACDHTKFGCAILQGIVNWLAIMLQLSVFGTIFIAWASIGSSVYPTNSLWIIVAMLAVVVFVILPYSIEVDGGVIVTTKSGELGDGIVYTLSLICGIILLCSFLLNIAQRILPKKATHDGITKRFLTPSNITLECQVKLAGSCKVNRLVRNACEIHATAELNRASGSGESSMLTYAKASDQRETFGSFKDTWQKIWKGNLFEEEGIWLPHHLYAGNLIQCVVCLLLGALFVELYRFELFQDGLKHLDQLGVSRSRLIIPLLFGFCCGEITIIIITVNYIPSTIRTILQFRSGGLQSLHDKKFQVLRLAVDNSTLLFGSIFWGTFFTSIIIGVFWTLLLGICLWPDFASTILILFANIIGICITVLLKWLVLIWFRRRFMKGYYRRSVGLTNFVGVILESWNLGLTTSYMLLRTFKLLIAATLFIGRVDIPFLSEPACYLGPVELDPYPLMFRKDILSHEAHRHPYIERLGVMYMLALRYNDFGSYACTRWRLLFVYALLPWMRKYRRKGDNDISGSDFKFAANRMWIGRMPPPKSSEEEEEGNSRIPPLDSIEKSEGVDYSRNEDKSEVLLIESLQKQNEELKRENELIIHAMVGSYNILSNSCPPNLF